MSFWSKLFGRAKPDEGKNPEPTVTSFSAAWNSADCGFELFASGKPDDGRNTEPAVSGVSVDRSRPGCGSCGRPRIECDDSAPYPYTVWKCSCGAIGSGAWLPDLDEVGDQLLEILGIDARVSEPCVPIDHSAISMQRYDVDKVERGMAEILESHGYEFRITPGHHHNERLYWARQINEKAR